ncbi:hypothetical protein WA171_006321 [Blastocystis sp. BT1]
MIQLIGAPGTAGFYLFQMLCVSAELMNDLKTSIYRVLCQNKSRILSIVKLYAMEYPDLPCFSNDSQRTLLALIQRLSPVGSAEECAKKLIEQAIGSWTTHWYDCFQFYVTGIF